MGGGSDTTNVTNTGLGDEQYSGIMDSLGEGGVKADAIAKALSAQGVNVNKLISDVSTAQGGVDAIQTSVGQGGDDPTGLYGEMAMNRGLLNSQATQLGNLSSDLNSVGQNVTGIQGSVDTGFSDVGQRFDTVDTNIGSVQSGMDAGFADAGQRFDTIDTNAAANAAAAQASMNTGFSDAASQLNQSTSDTSANINDASENLQANVLAGQGGLATSLGDLTGNVDTYNAALLDGQANLQNTADGFQTSFDTYVDRYGEDTELANQSRADLQTGMVNSAQRVREDLARIGAQTQQEVAQAAQGTNAAVEQGFVDQQAMMQNQASQFANDIVDLQSNLGDVVSRVDDTSARQYQRLAQSFNAQGQLLKNQILADGSVVNRSMDNSGIMTENHFNQQGQPLGTQTYDVLKMMSGLNEFKTQYTRSKPAPVYDTSYDGFTGLGNDGYGSISQGPMDNILSDGFFVNDPRRPTGNYPIIEPGVGGIIEGQPLDDVPRLYLNR